jgi:TPR repeat protein
MTLRIGENLAKEWNSDPRGTQLWDVVGLAETDPEAALNGMKQLAEEGSSLSMMFLGDAYLFGRYGLKKEPALAERWLRRSASAGSIEGAYLLARYLQGCGRHDAALVEYNKLAESGFSPALFVLGTIHYKGEIARKDIDKAFYYFIEASKLGHLHAKHWVSYIQMNDGLGIISWIVGFFKRCTLIIPFVKTRVMYPQSDRLRT